MVIAAEMPRLRYLFLSLDRVLMMKPGKIMQMLEILFAEMLDNASTLTEDSNGRQVVSSLRCFIHVHTSPGSKSANATINEDEYV